MALVKKIPTLLSVPMPPDATNMVWMKIAKEYCNTYLQGGMNAGSGSTTLPGIAATSVSYTHLTLPTKRIV